MISSAAIGIICKAPRAGRVKTRLIPRLGPARAAEISACFLRDIAASIASLPESVDARGYAIYAPSDAEEEMRALLPADFGLVCHADGDLGRVLLGATRDLLASGHTSVLLVNSDSPTLPTRLLRQAIEALNGPADCVVLGPATDGGYYLIAMKRAHAHLFSAIPWSTPDVLALTLKRAREIGLEVTLLPTWYDVDDAPSMRMLLDELGGARLPFATTPTAAGPASATHRFVV